MLSRTGSALLLPRFRGVFAPVACSRCCSCTTMFRLSAARGIDERMPRRLFEIRYPDNYFEFDARTEAPPPGVGQTLRRRGKLWKVKSRTHGTPIIVRVEAVEESRET